MYLSQNSLQVSKMTFVLIYDLCVENGHSYSQFIGGFMFSRGKEKRSEGDANQ